MITVDALAQFAPRADPAFAQALSDATRKFEITGRRLPHFMGQCHHESGGFTRLVENLNYTAGRLHVVWPARFPTIAAALPFANNPRALADKVYGGRLGNTEPDDGWTYRGRGLLQLTGRDNYRAAEDALVFPLEAEPDRVATPPVAALTAAWFWQSHGLNALADAEDIDAITKRINGGFEGLPDREARTAQARVIWP
jgi:putative chitinase